MYHLGVISHGLGRQIRAVIISPSLSSVILQVNEEKIKSNYAIFEEEVATATATAS